MKIVIETDEARFKDIQRIAEVQLERNHFQTAEQIIARGTPLPKGHGRLIDADELEECKEIMNTIRGESKYAVRMDDVRNMPTIIEADKEYGVKAITRGNCMACGKELTEGVFFCKECEEKGRKEGSEE